MVAYISYFVKVPIWDLKKRKCGEIKESFYLLTKFQEWMKDNKGTEDGL